jgi:hypothetical protein
MVLRRFFHGVPLEVPDTCFVCSQGICSGGLDSTNPALITCDCSIALCKKCALLRVAATNVTERPHGVVCPLCGVISLLSVKKNSMGSVTLLKTKISKLVMDARARFQLRKEVLSEVYSRFRSVTNKAMRLPDLYETDPEDVVQALIAQLEYCCQNNLLKKTSDFFDLPMTLFKDIQLNVHVFLRRALKVKDFSDLGEMECTFCTDCIEPANGETIEANNGVLLVCEASECMNTLCKSCTVDAMSSVLRGSLKTYFEMKCNMCSKLSISFIGGRAPEREAELIGNAKKSFNLKTPHYQKLAERFTEKLNEMREADERIMEETRAVESSGADSAAEVDMRYKLNLDDLNCDSAAMRNSKVRVRLARLQAAFECNGYDFLSTTPLPLGPLEEVRFEKNKYADLLISVFRKARQQRVRSVSLFNCCLLLVHLLLTIPHSGGEIQRLDIR